MGRTLSMHPTLVESLTIQQLEKRLSPKFIIKDNGCWEWIAALFPTGYGAFGITEAKRKFNLGATTAHRAMYELIFGRQKQGMVIDHLCRNRKCVNPRHLEAVTPKENLIRSNITLSTVNSSKTLCRNGHQYTADNTYIVQRSNGYNERRCKICSTEADKRYKEQK